MAALTQWETVRDGLYRYRDSCMVYAMRLGQQMLVVNAGTGAWIDAMSELPLRPTLLVLTHFFRDHSAGAVRAAGEGIEVWASHWEDEQLSDPLGLFSRRETYIIYDNQWDLFAPVEPVPVRRRLQDWEQLEVGDARITVIPTPGVSLGAISLLVEREGERGVFCGELIHAPGKVLRLAPLQYNYNDLPGARNLLYAIDQVRRLRPDWLAGSTGPQVITEPQPALALLSDRLVGALEARGIEPDSLAAAWSDGIEEITPHLYQSRHGEASTYFLVSDSGVVLSIDYGYRDGLGSGASYPYPRNRRALLHGLEPLRERFGIERIDAVLVTHFHDDHVNGIPTLQRLFGTRCMASETFAHILSDPAAYAFPCTWPEPIDVTPLANRTVHRWQEYEFELYPVSGHTRYSTIVALNVDGERVVATGDQYFFRDFERPGQGPAMHNHVYRNGAVLSSFRESQAVVEELQPTIILPGHGSAYRVPEAFYGWIDGYREEYERIHRDLMPLDDDEGHFEVDSRAGWLEPYRVRRNDATEFTITAHVRNPYPASARITLRLILPEGWRAGEAVVELGPREEGSARFTVRPSAHAVCRRRPIALEMTADGHPFGQIAEALVTLGEDRF